MEVALNGGTTGAKIKPQVPPSPLMASPASDAASPSAVSLPNETSSPFKTPSPPKKGQKRRRGADKQMVEESKESDQKTTSGRRRHVTFLACMYVTSCVFLGLDFGQQASSCFAILTSPLRALRAFFWITHAVSQMKKKRARQTLASGSREQMFHHHPQHELQ